MITSFIESKLKIAKYKRLGDGTYYGEIKGLRGLWVNAKSVKECKEEMKEVLEEWLLIKIRHGDSIPGLTTNTTFAKRSFHA